MKILIYQPRCSYYVGGGEIVPMEQAKFLSKLDHKITLLTTKAKFLNQTDIFQDFVDQNPDINIEYITLDDSFEEIYKIATGMNQFRWDIESYKVGLLAREKLSSIFDQFDLALVHYTTDVVAIPNKLRSFLFLHGYPSELNYLNSISLFGFKNYISVSEKIRDSWVKMLNINGNQVSLVYNGIDDGKFYPQTITKKYDFLYIGRLIEVKGIQYIVEAVKLITKEGKKVKFAIAGKGPYEEDLKKLVRQYNLEDSIDFLGFVDEKAKNQLYNSVKFCVLPSTDREGVLTTMLESSACAIPVITTKNTSMEEFVDNDCNGLLVEAKNIVEIKNAICKLLEDSSFLTILGENAFRTVKNSWTWTGQSANLSTLLKKLTQINKIDYHQYTQIAIDLDGTVTDLDGVIPQKLVEIINQLVNKQIKFIVCTGRSISSAIELLELYFQRETISKFAFVTSSGSHIYTLDINEQGYKFNETKVFEFDKNFVTKNSAISHFISENREKTDFKKTAILVNFDSKRKAEKELKKLELAIDSNEIKVYLYNSSIVISTSNINKSIALNYYLKNSEYTKESTICIGDLGNTGEADFEFLNSNYGFSVGSFDSSNTVGCNVVLNDNGDRVVGDEGTIFLLENILNS
jgi:HAD superfamily hydrolase (TIGR01484 family)